MAEQDKTELDVLRHSTAHVMAQAVCDLWPGTKYAIGPPIQDGFYYDFELPEQLSPDDGTIPASRIELGVHGDHGPRTVAAATVFGGAFQGAVDPGSFAGDDRRVWARACLDTSCAGWTPAT